MGEVGIKVLKDHLSEYLLAARREAGEG